MMEMLSVPTGTARSSAFSAVSPVTRGAPSPTCCKEKVRGEETQPGQSSRVLEKLSKNLQNQNDGCMGGIWLKIISQRILCLSDRNIKTSSGSEGMHIFLQKMVSGGQMHREGLILHPNCLSMANMHFLGGLRGG